MTYTKTIFVFQSNAGLDPAQSQKYRIPKATSGSQMSTRANIIVRQDGREDLWFYRHSDGYPETVLPSLEPLIEAVNDGRLRADSMQFAGWLILKGAHEQGQSWPPDGSSVDSWNTWKVGAYEPTPFHPHGDIEYLYTITLNGGIQNGTATLSHTGA